MENKILLKCLQMITWQILSEVYDAEFFHLIIVAQMWENLDTKYLNGDSLVIINEYSYYLLELAQWL